MTFADRAVSFQGVQGQLESTFYAHSGALGVVLSARKHNPAVSLELRLGAGTLVAVRLELDLLAPKIGLRHLMERDLPRLLSAGPKRSTELYLAMRDWFESPYFGLSSFERWLESLIEAQDPPRLAHHDESYFLPAWVRLRDLEHAPSSCRGHSYLSLAILYWKQRLAASPESFEATFEELTNIETHPTLLEGLRHALALPLPELHPSRSARRLARSRADSKLSSDTQFTRFVQRAGRSWAVLDHPDFPVLHFPRRALEGKIIHFRLQAMPDGVVLAYHQKTPPAWFAYRIQNGHAFMVPYWDRTRRTFVDPEVFIDALLSYRALLLTHPTSPDWALYPVGEHLLGELETALQGGLKPSTEF